MIRKFNLSSITSALYLIYSQIPFYDSAHSHINTLMSEMKVNILGQFLKTNDKIGYVVLDIDKRSSSKVMEELKKINETIRTRSLY